MRARHVRSRSRGGAVAFVALGAALLASGAAAVGAGAMAQQHAPQPAPAQAGTVGPPSPATARPSEPYSRPGTLGTLDRLAAALRGRRPAALGPVLPRSRPVALAIPAIGVRAGLGEVGLNPDGTLQVPSLFLGPGEPAWYRYSPTPGQPGPSVIVGHVDNLYGPAVFFRLGALRPGDRIEVTLADGAVATFAVDGVRRYPKADFPTAAVYGPVRYAGLRLITCGGPFDYSARHYLDNIVVFASLISAHRAQQQLSNERFRNSRARSIG